MVRSKKPVEVSASDLKNGWHDYLSRVSDGNEELVVTRYGRPIARVAPYEEPEERGGVFGCLAGSVTVHGDIVAPLGEHWEADD